MESASIPRCENELGRPSSGVTEWSCEYIQLSIITECQLCSCFLLWPFPSAKSLPFNQTVSTPTVLNTWEHGTKYDAFFRAKCDLLNCSITVPLRGWEGNDFYIGACSRLQLKTCRCLRLIFCGLNQTSSDIQCWRRKDQNRSDPPEARTKHLLTFQSNSWVSSSLSFCSFLFFLSLGFFTLRFP